MQKVYLTEQLNRKIRECSDKDIIVENCMGHRYIGAGIREKNIIVQGVPGNAMDSEPVMIIGGCAGSFLGEYQAGGRIIVMNLREEKYSTGNFCGTGMHGGKIYIRGQSLPEVLPVQVTVSAATAEEIEEIQRYVEGYCSFFGGDPNMLMQAGFHTLKSDEKQKYTQIYVGI